MREVYFPQRLTRYLQERLEYQKQIHGKDSDEYNALALQYIYDAREDADAEESNEKHYEAGVVFEGCQNVERLYQRHCCIEINFNCLANCRFCLRSNYDRFTLSDEQMDANVSYLSSINAEEVLLTGGDPFLTLKKLSKFTDKIIDKVPSVKIIRIATRTFTQDPDVIKDELITMLSKLKERVRVEVSTQINSYVELEDELVVNAIQKIINLGIPVCAQNVFLKGVNDTSEKLIKLYHALRLAGVEAHYLFHSVPMKGTHHLRPSVHKMISCYEELVNSGHITGRCKPILALMTDVGKITLTPSNYKKSEGGYIELRSNYKYEDRLAYNPTWMLSNTTWVDENGFLCVKYLDGED